MNKFAKMAVMAAIAGFSFAASAGVVIDDFTTGQSQLVASGALGTAASNTVEGAGILGGWRDLYVSKVSGSDLNTKSSTIGVDGGLLSFSNSPDVGGEAIIRWDGSNIASTASFKTGIDATGLQIGGLGVNLSDGTVGFEITVNFADLDFPFTMNAYTDENNWTSLTFLSTGTGTFFVDFSDFVNFGTVHGTGADFSNIGALEAIINTNGLISAVDVDIQLAQTVPEPESLALVGLGLLGLGAIRRRKSVK